MTFCFISPAKASFTEMNFHIDRSNSHVQNGKRKAPFPNGFSTFSPPSDSGNPASAQLRDFTVILNFPLSCIHTPYPICPRVWVTLASKQNQKNDHFLLPSLRLWFPTWGRAYLLPPLHFNRVYSGIATVILLKSMPDCAILPIELLQWLFIVLRINPLTL